jgi:hypothetical protein
MKPVTRPLRPVHPVSAMMNATIAMRFVPEQNAAMQEIEQQLQAGAVPERLELADLPTRAQMGANVGLIAGLEEALCENERLRVLLADYVRRRSLP